MIVRRIKCTELTTRDRGPGNVLSRHASFDLDGVGFTVVLNPTEHADLARAFAAGEPLVVTVGVELPEVP